MGNDLLRPAVQIQVGTPIDPQRIVLRQVRFRSVAAYPKGNAEDLAAIHNVLKVLELWSTTKGDDNVRIDTVDLAGKVAQHPTLAIGVLVHAKSPAPPGPR